MNRLVYLYKVGQILGAVLLLTIHSLHMTAGVIFGDEINHKLRSEHRKLHASDSCLLLSFSLHLPSLRLFYPLQSS